MQVIYLIESDRQENRTEENVLSPKWWMIFKYKLAQTLIDERDGFTLIPALEWGQSAALADLVLIIPSAAPTGGFITARNLLCLRNIKLGKLMLPSSNEPQTSGDGEIKDNSLGLRIA
ncbi:hypothetical protein V6N11_016291 [Hibiscus sabdariffa]|uniref:Uncharacterized protein n=1 Tax=Hibiscus sabdariffa TaxID=183260 RepID=A0ABR2TUT5_9ROSI